MLLFVTCLLLATASAPPLEDRAAEVTITPRVTLTNAVSQDQDDACIWIHPDDRTRSTIVASDKYAKKLFVYGLDGTVLQTLDLPGRPGNIDLRYNFPLDGELVDIVAYNDRSNDRVVVHRVDPVTGNLTRVDDGTLLTGPNYGFTLYRSPRDGRYHAFATSETGDVRQLLLSESGGQVSGTLVRSWSFSSIVEGCVADDETGHVYFSEENVGIWKTGAEPEDGSAGTLVAAVGDGSGLRHDVEGITIYYAAGGGGYLIASSQGNSTFKVYERAAPHSFVTTFQVTGVGSTDGVDVANVDFGPDFPMGLFVCHNDLKTPKALEVCAYEDLGLVIDVSYWDPRAAGSTSTAQTSWGGLKSRFR